MSYDMSSLTSHDGDNDDKPNMPRVAGPETDDMNPANSGAGDDLLPPERPSGMPGSRPGNSGVIYPAEPELGLSVPRNPVDMNAYQNKKTLAQGMMDLALLSANASQLRTVFETEGSHRYYYYGLVMIGLSVVLQFVVGIALIINTRYNIGEEEQVFKANRVNNFTTIAIYVITVINVFISAFGFVESSLH